MSEYKYPPGHFYENIPFDEYLAIDAFSKSKAKHILKSPAHYLAYERKQAEGKKSEALIFGSLVDCLLLEPETFSSIYKVRPDTYENANGEEKPWSGNANICKAMLAEFRDEGFDVISSKLKEEADGVVNAVKANRTATALLETGKKQVSAFWLDPITGVYCKCRYDNLNEGSSIDDFKTTKDASKGSFRYDISQYGYDIQGAAYLDAYRIITGEDRMLFKLIVAEKTDPWGVANYCLREDSLEVGKHLWYAALEIYARCKDTDKWPGYPDEIFDIDIPPYVISRVLEEGEILN